MCSHGWGRKTMNLINQLRQALHTEAERTDSIGMFVEVIEALAVDGDGLASEIDQFFNGNETLRSYVYTTLYGTSRNEQLREQGQ